MILFFRKIRQGLLTENKFSKYLLYAIGEIILVVIGILIALQINNWNEDRKESDQRDKLIEALLADAATTHERLEFGRQQAYDINSKQAHFLQIINDNVLSISMDSLKTLASAIFQVTNFRPALSSYETALSTGDIKLIKNNQLLETYIAFKDSYDWFVLHQNISGDMVYLGNVWELRKKLGSANLLVQNMGPYPSTFDLTKEEFWNLIHQKEVYATFESMQWLVRNQIEALQRAKEANDQITALLKEEVQPYD